MPLNQQPTKRKKEEPSAKRFVMPSWMKPYEEHFINTGGWKVAKLMNADSSTNYALGALQLCVESQIVLLNRLYANGLLRAAQKKRKPQPAKKSK